MRSAMFLKCQLDVFPLSCAPIPCKLQGFSLFMDIYVWYESVDEYFHQLQCSHPVNQEIRSHAKEASNISQSSFKQSIRRFQLTINIVYLCLHLLGVGVCKDTEPYNLTVITNTDVHGMFVIPTANVYSYTYYL